MPNPENIWQESPGSFHLTELLCLLTSTSRHELLQLRGSSTNDSQMFWADCQHPNWPPIKQRTRLSQKCHISHILCGRRWEVWQTLTTFPLAETISSEWRGPSHECHFCYGLHTSKQKQSWSSASGVLGVRVIYLKCFLGFFFLNTKDNSVIVHFFFSAVSVSHKQSRIYFFTQQIPLNYFLGPLKSDSAKYTLDFMFSFHMATAAYSSEIVFTGPDSKHALQSMLSAMKPSSFWEVPWKLSLIKPWLECAGLFV